ISWGLQNFFFGFLNSRLLFFALVLFQFVIAVKMGWWGWNLCSVFSGVLLFST
ncbi:hypothetical protein GLOIN_2v1611711, partial [Rhizophagus irregularis DAOM 181602=DAOM 197198]